MRGRWIGSACAAAVAIAVFAGDRVHSQSQSSGPSQTPAAADRPTLPESENPGNRQKVTLAGCLAREAGPASTGEQFVLRSAQIMPQDDDRVASTRGNGTRQPSVGTSGASSGATDDRAGPKPPDKPVPELKAYRLHGDRERGIAPWVGYRVTIVGVLDESGDPAVATTTVANAAAGPSPDGTAANNLEVRIAGAVTVLSLMPAEKACTGSD